MKHEDAVSVAQSSTRQGSAGMDNAPFDYGDAFSRNIGWITDREQQVFRAGKVAIAGMGGVGGAHLLVLARLGIGRFNIADLDRFEVANFNRQAGAAISTIDREKVDVMAEMARDINPEADIRTFPNGVDDDNIDAFLYGVDLYIDGLDFFVMGIRRKVFARCAALGIPAITAAPVGFGTAYIVFMPGKMTFEQLFRMEGLSDSRQSVNFAAGLTPSSFHRSYLADPSRLDLAGKRGPSTAAAINLCAGVVGAEAAKILLGCGRIYAAPWVHQFDAFRSRWRRSYLPFGNAGPLQSLKRMIGYKAFAALSRNARPAEDAVAGTGIEPILDFARWAPSGDNSQPWRFEITGDDSVIVHIASKDGDIYDYDGRPTLISAGMLLETMRIAASRFGRTLDWLLLDGDGKTHRIACDMPPSADMKTDLLFQWIPIRSVDRQPYRRGGLTETHKAALAAAVGDEFEIVWHEELSARLGQVRINMLSTDIRLRLRAAYDVHRRILDFENRFSRTGVPATAIGLDAMTRKLMRWVMQSWRRVDVMNRFMAGTLNPRIQMDLVPGLLCAAHYSIWRRKPAAGGDPEALLRTGQAVQRFWLKLTELGLVMQPAIAPIIFAWYARNPAAAPDDAGAGRRVGALNDRLLAGNSRNADDLVYRGRVGHPVQRAATSRSIRQPLKDLTTG